jgi:hypothetical protein
VNGMREMTGILGERDIDIGVGRGQESSHAMKMRLGSDVPSGLGRCCPCPRVSLRCTLGYFPAFPTGTSRPLPAVDSKVRWGSVLSHPSDKRTSLGWGTLHRCMVPESKRGAPGVLRRLDGAPANSANSTASAGKLRCWSLTRRKAKRG